MLISLGICMIRFQVTTNQSFIIHQKSSRDMSLLHQTWLQPMHTVRGFYFVLADMVSLQVIWERTKQNMSTYFWYIVAYLAGWRLVSKNKFALVLSAVGITNELFCIFERKMKKGESRWHNSTTIADWILLSHSPIHKIMSQRVVHSTEALITVMRYESKPASIHQHSVKTVWPWCMLRFTPRILPFGFWTRKSDWLLHSTSVSSTQL